MLVACEGFVMFSLLRRDHQQSGHVVQPMREENPTYVGITIWTNREAFEGWRNGNSVGGTNELDVGGRKKRK